MASEPPEQPDTIEPVSPPEIIPPAQPDEAPSSPQETPPYPPDIEQPDLPPDETPPPLDRRYDGSFLQREISAAELYLLRDWRSRGNRFGAVAMAF